MSTCKYAYMCYCMYMYRTASRSLPKTGRPPVLAVLRLASFRRAHVGVLAEISRKSPRTSSMLNGKVFNQRSGGGARRRNPPFPPECTYFLVLKRTPKPPLPPPPGARAGRVPPRSAPFLRQAAHTYIIDRSQPSWDPPQRRKCP